MARSRHALISLGAATALAAATLTPPAQAAVGDTPSVWTEDQTVRSPLNGPLASWDVADRAAIAVSLDISGAVPVFNFFTAIDEEDWTFGGSMNATNVTGTPDVATDGRYWKVVWQRRAVNGGYEVVTKGGQIWDNLGGGFQFSAVAEQVLAGNLLSPPQPAIDGTFNSRVGEGPYYLLTYINDPADPLFGSTVMARDFADRGWQDTKIVAGYSVASGTVPQRPRPVLAQGGEAAIVYELQRTVGGLKSLTLATVLRARGIGAELANWLNPLPVHSDALAQTSGEWDLSMPESAANSVSIAWVRDQRDERSVAYVRMSLGFGANLGEDLVGGISDEVTSVSIAAGKEARDVLAWVQQEGESGAIPQAYRLRSQVISKVNGTSFTSTLATGTTIGRPQLSMEVNDGGRVWLAYSTTDANRDGTVQVFSAAYGVPNAFWTGATPAKVVAPVANVAQLELGVLAPWPSDTYPRLIWENVNSAANLRSLMASRLQDAADVAPGPPRNVTAVAGDRKATVTWTVPADPGGSPITGYTVTSFPGNLQCTTNGALTCDVTGLTNATPYSFTVIATNAGGPGRKSDPSNTVVPQAGADRVPGEPQDVTALPGDARAVVRWKPPNTFQPSPVTGYTATANPGGRTCTIAVADPDELGVCEVTGLTNGTTYTFTVVAINAAGNSAPSAPSNQVTPSQGVRVPGTPTNVTAVAGDSSATITWQIPADTGSPPAHMYIAASQPGGFTCSRIGETSCEIRGLTNGTTYTFTVKARNGLGDGLPSAPSNAVTPQARAGAPGPPTNVTAVAGDSSATVSWQPPASEGSSPIVGYVVTSNPGAWLCTTAAPIGGSGAPTTCEVVALTNGTSYTFTVVARNARDGSGPPSAPSNTVTPQATQPPEPPARMKVRAKPGRVIVVRWSISPSPQAAGYVLAVQRNGGAWRERDMGAARVFKPTVKLGPTYCYRVAAVNAAGVKGNWTNQACVTARR